MSSSTHKFGKFSSNPEIGSFQKRVYFTLFNISNPTIRDEIEALLERVNPDDNCDLPFITEGSAANESLRECLQKLNELYSNWKEDGFNDEKLFGEISKEIYLCTSKYCGASEEDIKNLASLSMEEINVMNNCSIF